MEYGYGNWFCLFDIRFVDDFYMYLLKYVLKSATQIMQMVFIHYKIGQ